MKVTVFPKANSIELADRPVPEVGEEDVLLRVHLCGICRSDVDAWQGKGLKQYPYSPGHEYCGVIEKTGPGVRGFEVGQRVVVDPNLSCGACRFCMAGRPNLCDMLKLRTGKSNGGLAEYVVVNHRMVYLLPEGFPDVLAVFIEPLSCALHVAETASAQAGEQVVIFGGGLLGYLTALVLKSWCGEIVIVEPLDRRRENLRTHLDVRAVAPDVLSALEREKGFGIAIDCSGNPAAVAQAVRILGKGGRLVLAGLVMHARHADISFVDITMKELVLKGSWLNPRTFPKAIKLAVVNQGSLAALETETFSLDHVHDAFERAKDPNAPKVLVRPLREGS